MENDATTVYIGNGVPTTMSPLDDALYHSDVNAMGYDNNGRPAEVRWSVDGHTYAAPAPEIIRRYLETCAAEWDRVMSLSEAEFEAAVLDDNSSCPLSLDGIPVVRLF